MFFQAVRCFAYPSRFDQFEDFDMLIDRFLKSGLALAA
jgi:hypothetical protein